MADLYLLARFIKRSVRAFLVLFLAQVAASVAGAYALAYGSPLWLAVALWGLVALVLGVVAHHATDGVLERIKLP